MPRNPPQYRGLSRRAQIARWLRHGGNLTFGNLVLKDTNNDRTLLTGLTYGTMFAVVEPLYRVAHVLMNLPYRSCTSTGHRNRMLEALESENYNITEILHQPDLADIFTAIKFRTADEHLATIEEIDENELPALTPEVGVVSAPPEAAAIRNPCGEIPLDRPNNPWYTPGGESIMGVDSAQGPDRTVVNPLVSRHIDPAIWHNAILRYTVGPDMSDSVSTDNSVFLQRITEISDELARRARITNTEEDE